MTRPRRPPASERFLEAFNAIEGHLRQQLSIDRSKSFFAVVEIAARKDRAVRRYEVDLKEYADLRNAIVHERTDGRPIAEPHESAVSALEAILERLSRPPRLGDLFRHQVARAEGSERVGNAAKAMFEGNFSQLPVYDESRFVELLTAETIARWLAHELASGIGILEEATVSEVLRYTEDAEHYLFQSRRASAFDALAAFEDFAERGKSLDAILITDSGGMDEKPLGILTTFDIPKLLDAVGTRKLTSLSSDSPD